MCCTVMSCMWQKLGCVEAHLLGFGLWGLYIAHVEDGVLSLYAL